MKKIQKIILAFMLGIVPLQSALADSKADALVNAALKGKLEQVKTLIEKEGIDINAKTNDGSTALMGASATGHLGIVQYLISKGVDINAKADNGATALMLASQMGHLGVAKALVEGKKGLLSMFSKGADINAKADNGETALMAASINGHLEVVKYLIDKGADINAKDNDGQTALMKASICSTALLGASINGHLEVVKYLISKGANVNAVMSIEAKGVVYNLTALDFAETNAIKQVLKKAGAKSAKEIQK